ncbi:MAG: rRNA maturation RNase YbeY [Candidatus Kapaibacterium sp.]
MAIKINIFNSSSLKYLPKTKVERAVRRVLNGENISMAEVNIVYLDDEDIRSMNVEFLNHDYPTDVISFTLEPRPLIGEIYIGAGVAAHQAREYGVSTSTEILRLACHGALHLAGHDDDTPPRREEMRRLEDKYMAGE